MKMIDLNCPKCGATINPDMEKGRCECKYCGHQMLIEKEDTLEEIAAKAQSKSYGYHKGKLQAEAEAGIIREGTIAQKKTLPTPVIIVIALVILGLIIIVTTNVSKPKVNPFDGIQVSFKGTDGDGDLVIKTVFQDGIDPNRIKYEASKYSDLCQGDTISIVATSSEYQLTEKSKTYVVEGLDTYLTDLANIPVEFLELIAQKAADVQDINLSSAKKDGSLVGMKPVKLFLMTDGARNNRLYVVHEVNFSTEKGDIIRYVSTGFDNVVLRKGAQTSLDLSYGAYYGNVISIGTVIPITGYESVDAVRTDVLTSQAQAMELTELDY